MEYFSPSEYKKKYQQKSGRPTNQERIRRTREAARDENGHLACPNCLGKDCYIEDYDYDKANKVYLFKYRCKPCKIYFHVSATFEEVFNRKRSREESS